jgi:uncharacterized protein involved in outer membrane biogenesis
MSNLSDEGVGIPQVFDADLSSVDLLVHANVNVAVNDVDLRAHANVNVKEEGWREGVKDSNSHL